jgi:hypothetical protein
MFVKLKEMWKNRKRFEFSKIIVSIMILNGIAWTWCSYYLAYIGKEEIAETLSKTVVTEILGVIAVYSLKSLFENLSKNNDWPDKTKFKNTDRDC